MRHAIAPCGAGAGVAENAVLVGIERHRLAMPFNIRAGRIHIGKSALALDHLEVHQLTGRVVDIDEQGALRPAILKPPMLRTVDLDQRVAAVTAQAPGLVAFVRQRYTRYFADLGGGFDAWLGGMSANTSSGLKRKAKKLAKHSGGTLDVRAYRTPDELAVFHPRSEEHTSELQSLMSISYAVFCLK